MVHTPGPWEQDKHQWYFVINREGRNIASVGHSTLTRAETEANARLIAASPDLLKACKEMLDMWHRAANEFDWGKSALSGETIRLMNEVPIQVRD